ncbi:MAG: carboxylating nicotinate-nucleotide diphosphorylase [Candidatus Margulisbacteria bacterium]|nr:carboxylating nicotinate-nucleotide diphosphorylase [Candidatus Margulisiibacteriota bacterium]
MSIKEITDFLVKLALAEDVGRGDITTRAIIQKDQKAKAILTAKEAGVICGVSIAAEVFHHVDHRIKFSPKVKDGVFVQKGKVIAVVSGPARGILTGERVALNFLQHLSGIATLTRAFVSRVASRGSRVKILDTRKTIPGLRVLEKYAVKMGGGVNHRMGLYDAILIKDNHIKLAGGIERAVEKVARRGSRVEIEVRTLNEVQRAIAVGVDTILLDNMSVKVLRAAVKLCKKVGVKTEASGGVNLNNVAVIAKAGVDYISVGALTHSAKALDINLKIV